MDSHYDVVVVGAGLQGLAAARTYIKIEPDANLLIIDSNESVGGVWAKENLYPGLRTNNLRGTYEYTDFPMHDGFGIKKEEHITGEVAGEYLNEYAKKFDLTKRILLSTKAETAEKVKEGWKLRIVHTDSWKKETIPANNFPLKIPTTITATKLIVATGLTSRSLAIALPGKDSFNRPLLTFDSFRHEAPHLLASPSVNNIVVYGGSKAAYDCVYLFANAGKHVTWIIRTSGYGPTYMAPAHIYLGPFRCWLEKLTSTRLFTFFSPCVWGEADGFGYLRGLLHRTGVGRWMVDKFWAQLENDLVKQTGLDGYEELQKLIPDQGAFWYATGLGILNYPSDIHEFVREGLVTIMRKDVSGLEPEGKVKFIDGTSVDVDAMVCSTGWKSTSGVEFLPESLHADIGIPSASFSKTQTEVWTRLDEKADIEIFSRFPKLVTGPKPAKNPLLITNDDGSKKEFTPWRLWRGIAPPKNDARDLVFLGMILNLQGALRSEISSLWAYAYLNSQLSPSSQKTISTNSRTPKNPNSTTLSPTTKDTINSDNATLYDTALFSRFGRWRYPYSFGARVPDFVFDGIPYFDLLLHDLGLSGWRKGWGWLGEVLGGSYGQDDYRGLLDEWIAKKKKQ